MFAFRGNNNGIIAMFISSGSKSIWTRSLRSMEFKGLFTEKVFQVSHGTLNLARIFAMMDALLSRFGKSWGLECQATVRLIYVGSSLHTDEYILHGMALPHSK